VITIRQVEEKPVWEEFNLNSTAPTFLQSWAWGEFQKSLGRQIHRLGIFENNNLVGISLLVEERARVASFLYCPGGPVFTTWSRKYLDTWQSSAFQIAKEENLSFLRADPREIEKGQEKLLKDSGFVTAPEYTQPACTGIIDLTPSEEEILGKMTPSTRNNIRASQRKGVATREGKASEVKTFLGLLEQTAKRKALTLPRERDYHKKQFDSLGWEGLVKLFIAEYEGRALAAALGVFYGETAYYLHAASSLELPKLRPSYPLVWFSIRESKKAGLKYFDFWGVAENDAPAHPWAGVTSFKLSFGAERKCYSPPYDLPFQGSYRFIRILETARRPLRKILRFARNR
jgi:lipid II:glycine glycyltransferase (peptidoglycan interpeptide bridge formation enzyme)